MVKKVLITRAIDQARDFAFEIEVLGATPIFAPLLEVIPLNPEIENSPFPHAIILTSQNALVGVKIPQALKTLPVFCIGDETAKTAQNMGFRDVVSCHGFIDRLPNLVHKKNPGGRDLLYLRGTDVRHKMGAILADYTVREIVTYDARAVRSFPPEIIEHFGEIDVVTLFSPRTSQILAELVDKHELQGQISHIKLLSLSQAVLESVKGLGWGVCVCAEQPDQYYMLKALKTLL